MMEVTSQKINEVCKNYYYHCHSNLHLVESMAEMEVVNEFDFVFSNVCDFSFCVFSMNFDFDFDYLMNVNVNVEKAY